MTDISDLQKALSEPFDQRVLGTLNKGGTRLTYIPIAEIIVRLNSTFGVGNWNTQVVSAIRPESEPDWVIAHVRLSALVGDHWTAKEQFGGQKIKRTRNNEVVDLGDEYKGAISDALKKCAQQFGIGIELARKDEALRWQDEQDNSRLEEESYAALHPEEAVGPVAQADIDALTSDIDTLIPKAKDALRAWWKESALPAPRALTAENFDVARQTVTKFIERQRAWLEKNPQPVSEDQAANIIQAKFPGTTEVDAVEG